MRACLSYSILYFYFLYSYLINYWFEAGETLVSTFALSWLRPFISASMELRSESTDDDAVIEAAAADEGCVEAGTAGVIGLFPVLVWLEGAEDDIDAIHQMNPATTISMTMASIVFPVFDICL